MDVRRTLASFRAVPEFQLRRDPRPFPNWNQLGVEEREVLMKGYCAAYDKEYKELEEVWLRLSKAEQAEAAKWKSEEEQKKKEKKKKTAMPTTPVASGSGSGKGKEKVVEINDSDSKPDLAFRETCIGCEWAKRTLKKLHQSLINLDIESENRNHLEAEGLYYKFQQQMLDGLHMAMDQLMKADELELGLLTLQHRYQVDMLVPKNLQDSILDNCGRIIDRYNKIALTYEAQMKRIALKYQLGKAFKTQVMLLDCDGDVVFETEAGSVAKRGRPEDEDTESGPTKKARLDEGMASEEIKEKEKRRNRDLKRMWRKQ
ncbi:hypothetical protein M422DRAFT_256179 [Sphaerobolus stellatus SS14]|uniref:Uncharacterized protein n=1 Tax=Sphaerobolus stellatus (strain SS14) TaxID=990650 RepID=A0A0C9VRY5_SPHS4|nr:hypothetical protein M422DRAFT_256179 [Sphaerobolus stellatus SS14]